MNDSERIAEALEGIQKAMEHANAMTRQHHDWEYSCSLDEEPRCAPLSADAAEVEMDALSKQGEVLQRVKAELDSEFDRINGRQMDLRYPLSR